MAVKGEDIRLIVLITAHKNMGQLIRLIGAIRHPQITVYVHIDKKSSLQPSQLPSDVRLVKNRVEVSWRLYSQVEAIVNSMAEIVQNEASFDYLTLISGQDYPIVSTSTILETLAARAGTDFMHHVPLDSTGWYKARVRFERFYFQSYPNRLVQWAGLGLAFLADLAGWKRPFLKGFKPWGGSVWWTLTKPSVEYILTILRSNHTLVRFMKKTIHPDEILFQTILMNSPFAPHVENRNFRYIEWIKGNPNPNLLTTADLDRIVASGEHFARKFDSEVDEHILDLLDDFRNH